MSGGPTRYRDRREAGRALARHLREYAGDDSVTVLGLPRGGVVVAFEVARALGAPLDVLVPRKIGAPGNAEYAIGAITDDGEAVWNEAEHGRADPRYLKRAVEAEHAEAQRRLAAYRGDRPPLTLIGRTAVLVDDGVATGLTMRAAIRSARQKGAARVVVAVPHGAPDALLALAREADSLVAIDRPLWYGSVGQYYEDFPQVDDATVVSLLSDA